MYKSTGGANLTWSGLEETILDAEISLNNRPLTYLEDDAQLLVLTPNAMTFASLTFHPKRMQMQLRYRFQEAR